MLQCYIFFLLKGNVFIVSSNSPFTKAEKYIFKKSLIHNPLSRDTFNILIYFFPCFFNVFVWIFIIFVTCYVNFGFIFFYLTFYFRYFLTSLNLLLNKFFICCILAFCELSILCLMFIFLLKY